MRRPRMWETRHTRRLAFLSRLLLLVIHLQRSPFQIVQDGSRFMVKATLRLLDINSHYHCRRQRQMAEPSL